MSSFYARHILPWVLDAAMKDRAFQSLRSPTLAKANGKILEIGFGSGANMLEYPSSVREITAIDPSQELYAMARERIAQSGIHVDFVLGTAECLPFDDSTFDTVVSTWSLCSIPDVQVALHEIFRVLKPGGRFLFVEHGSSPDPFWQCLQRWLTPVWKRVAGGCHLDRHIQVLIQQSGFVLYTHADFAFEGRKKKLTHLYQGEAVKPFEEG